MLVKLKNSPAPTISTILAFCAVGGHYSAVTSANWVRVIYGKERNDWFTLSHREFNANFEIIKQEPTRSSDETADEIAEWHGHWKADPISSMSQEIHQLREMLTAAQAVIDLTNK